MQNKLFKSLPLPLSIIGCALIIFRIKLMVKQPSTIGGSALVDIINTWSNNKK